MTNRGLLSTGRGNFKRGNSMDSWLRDTDEDLVLFHEMQARERSNFLHPSIDDIDASLSTKFGGLLGNRHSVSAPSRKGDLDLLLADAEKNDYDWLLTPPGTPLFPSLDQDVLIKNVSHKGVLRRSSSTSKTSRLLYSQEPSPKGLRGNVSPRWPSTASCTSSTNGTARGRSSSPSRNGSTCSLRSSTPSRRSPTPIRGVSETTGRSTRSPSPARHRTNTTPTIRSSSVHTLGTRNRGSSLSPKLQAWHPSSLLGFSSEPPPNLRTSISDHSTVASHGATLSSSHGIACGARNPCFETLDINQSRLLPVSPNTSDSYSSFFSQDHCSSQTSKGSVASSCDDDAEFSQLNFPGSRMTATDCTFTGAKWVARMDSQPGSRHGLTSKRELWPPVSAETTLFVGNTTLKPIELLMHQVDRRQSSQSMFQPLISNGPALSFSSIKDDIIQCRPNKTALDSSITICSNANSESEVCALPENEISDEYEFKESESKASMPPDVPAKELTPDGSEALKGSRINGRLDRHGNHFSLNLEGCDIQSISSPDDLHQCRNGSIDGYEITDVEIDLSSEQHRRSWNGSRIEGDNERVCQLGEDQYLIDGSNYDSTVLDWACLDPRKDNASNQSKEENMDHLFVDILEDLSRKTENSMLQKLELDEQNNSFPYLQPSEAEVPQICPALKVTPGLKQEANAALELAIRCPLELHKSMSFERDCDLDYDLKQFNKLGNQGKLIPRGLLEHQLSGNQYCDGNRDLNSNIKAYGDDGCDFHVRSIVNSAKKSSSVIKHSAAAIYPHMSYENRSVDTKKSGSLISACNARINHSGARSADGSMPDAGRLQRDSYTKIETSLRLEAGCTATERDMSCEGSASISFLCSQNLPDQEKRVDMDESDRRNLCNMACDWINTGHKVMPSTLEDSIDRCENWPKIGLKESCQEYFIDVSGDTSSSVSKISKGIETVRDCSNILLPENATVSSPLSTEAKKRSQVCEVAYSKSDINDKTIGASIHTSVGSPFINICDPKCNPKSIDHTDLSTQKITKQCIEHDATSSAELKRTEAMGIGDFVSSGFTSELHLQAENISIIKVAGNEQNRLQRDLESGFHIVNLVEPKPLQASLEIAMIDVGEMDKGKCANSSWQCSSVPQDLEQGIDTLGICQPEVTFPSRNLTKDILFCNSIVHDMAYKTATTAIDKDKHNSVASTGSTGELARLYLSPEVVNKNLPGENRRGSIIGASFAVNQTATYMQRNQKIALQQAHTFPCTQSHMNRKRGVEMRSKEPMSHLVAKVPQQDYCQVINTKSRCRCSVM